MGLGRSSPRESGVCAVMVAADPIDALSFAGDIEDAVRQSDTLMARVEELSKEVRFTLAVATVSGAPIQDQRGTLTAENYQDFRPDPDAADRAVARAEKLGLRVLRRGRFGISVAGSAELISELTGQKLVMQAAERRLPGPAPMFARDMSPPRASELFLAPTDSLTVRAPAAFDRSVDDMVFTPPPLYFDSSPQPPMPSYPHVTANEIRALLNVPETRTGKGVKIGMVDTGFYPHPFYKANGYRYAAVPTSTAPAPYEDTHGHGTAMAFNAFAVAPEVELLGFQQTQPPENAVEEAADAGVDIISCSWGYNSEQIFPTLQATLLDIVQEGKILLFAAGNGHYAWPGSQPEILSIGGVHADPEGALEASNYASGFMSSLFPGRRVPDVCGLVGQLPRGVYIVMPTAPGCAMDSSLGGNPYPQFDETGTDDGWVGASGTSAATPQVAGVVALMLEEARAQGKQLDTETVRTLLTQTARAVTRGRNQMGIPAVGQPNTAVGWGLVNAAAAIARV